MRRLSRQRCRRLGEGRRHRRRAGRLGEHDPGEDDDAAGDLPAGEHLLEPQPGDDRGEHGLDGGDQAAAVGGRCRSAAIDSQNGTTAPRTTIQATSTQSGTSAEPIDTGTRSARTLASNSHHGAATAQKSAAATKLQQVSATGSRVTVPRSPIR